MRWRIRLQLLVPLLLLLLGVLAVSVWLALAAAGQARQHIETRVRQVALNLSAETGYPLTENVLVQMKRLSGADYLLVPRQGTPVSTLGAAVLPIPPPATAGDDWHTLRLGPPIVIGAETYLCGGIRLVRAGNTGDLLYILYPESLWQDALWEAVWPVLVLGGSVALGSVALTIGLGGRLSRRIRELERRTRLIAAGDFSPMPLPAPNDEICDLTRSVNEMAQKLALLQETIRRSERLRLLGQVSGGLVHQVRNGLAGARLAVQLYRHEQAGHTDTTALEVALRQLTLLETSLKRFLNLGHTDPCQRAPCSLTALVSEAVELLRPRCQHAGIALHWQPPAEPVSTLGDGGQLEQLLLNLLGNAVEAAGPGGAVEVKLGQHKPQAPARGPCTGVFVEVWDTGPGPPAEIQDRLFEPFVTGKPEGVGLGLAVAQQVAEAHGGRLLWQREGERTCFRLELPDEAEARRASETNPDYR